MSKGKKKQTLGLALSGGGYRSAIFNYGVLRGLYQLRVLGAFDYLSVVSGGSWIGTPFAATSNPKWFFRRTESHPNFVEEAFESLLVNPVRVAQEVAMARKNANIVSNVYGRLLSRTFLREQGMAGRWKPLAGNLLRDRGRPFLIVNGTVSFRRPGSFDITQECFEMTKLYCGSRSLGYIDSDRLEATEHPIRVRDAIAISGAALAAHIPALGSEVAGFGLSREVDNFTRRKSNAADDAPDSEHIDVADGGHYNNLGVESLINRGCGYIVIVDAEHDPETIENERSNQSYHGLRTLLGRHHIRTPMTEAALEELDVAGQVMHRFISDDDDLPEILYIKLKSSAAFDALEKDRPYNKPGFLRNLFGQGEFSFDPQFSTAKLDYDFAEHRNLSNLGSFCVESPENTAMLRDFVSRST